MAPGERRGRSPERQISNRWTECTSRARDRPPDGVTRAMRRVPQGLWSPRSFVVARFGAQRGRRRLDVAAFGEDFHAPLRLFELRMAEPRQLHAALEQLERLLQREVAILEPLHDRFELADRRLKVLDCRIHNHSEGLRPSDSANTRSREPLRRLAGFPPPLKLRRRRRSACGAKAGAWLTSLRSFYSSSARTSQCSSPS